MLWGRVVLGWAGVGVDFMAHDCLVAAPKGLYSLPFKSLSHLPLRCEAQHF